MVRIWSIVPILIQRSQTHRAVEIESACSIVLFLWDTGSNRSIIAFHQSWNWDWLRQDKYIYYLIFNTYYYRPQRSCGQGNVFTGVCLSTGGGCLPQCILGCHTPPDQADTPLDQGDPPGLGRHPPGTRQTPRDQADPPGPGRPPRTRETPPRDQADPPGTRQTTPRTRQTPWEADSSIRSTSGRYASYWNAFLCWFVLQRWPKDSCYSPSKIKISKCAKKEIGIIGLQWCA